jgi:hypothetical protein
MRNGKDPYNQQPQFVAARMREELVRLSEREQRLLDQISHHLCADDPKFAAALRPARVPSVARRLATRSVAGVTVGVALALGGLVANNIILMIPGLLDLVITVAYAVAVVADPEM